MLTYVAVSALVALTLASSLDTVVPPRPRSVQGDACALLTLSEVNTAIEATSEPGQHLVASNTKQCMWTDAPSASLDHRRVVLTYSVPAAFDFGKKTSHPAAEAVSGVGDDAYYEFFGADAPALVVKKGGTVITIRLLNGLKAKALDMSTLKARELVLAKAAAAKA